MRSNALLAPSPSLVLTLGVVLGVGLCPVSSANDRLESSRLADEAVQLLEAYLKVDTTNPPGNEGRAVAFLARVLEAEGIPYETVETAPGRANLWARLEGGDRPGLALLHHTDVVPADAKAWTEPPFSGHIRDGELYGRGALDTKGLGILHLIAFLDQHRSGTPRSRPLLFLATADEEAGGFLGAGWLTAHRPELFADIGFLLNEGGSGSFGAAGPVWSVEVAQKVPLWLRLVSRDRPGHGSTPRYDSAVSRLVRALARLERHDFEARVVPAVASYMAELAEVMPSLVELRDPQAFVKSGALGRLERDDPRLHSLFRNTCAITRLEAGKKINVVPDEAVAELDCRLLPDQDTAIFLAEIEALLDEPAIEIDTIMAFAPSSSAPTGELFEVLRAACEGRYPGSHVLPSVISGFTDSHFFRDLGIKSYGFHPMLLPVDVSAGIHGNDERLPVAAYREAVPLMVDIVDRLMDGRPQP